MLFRLIPKLTFAASNPTAKANSSNSSSSSCAEKALEKFKTTYSDIKWIVVDNNTAYVGYVPVPDVFRERCKAMAIDGNKATDFGFHVWAFDASKVSGDKNSIQNAINSNKALFETTARHGKIEK